MSDEELYARVETCRRKLLGYSFTSEEARREVWAAEDELYALEEALLASGEPANEPPALL
jgi:hypothetical protein